MKLHSVVLTLTSCHVSQVPMGRSWGDISEGVRVEVPNTDSSLPMKVYWIAGIIKLAGTRPSVHKLKTLKSY